MINDTLLFATALIWGLAFVAQRVGTAYIGPFWFNGIRFMLGAVSLLPLMVLLPDSGEKRSGKTLLIGGLVSGVCLFLGSTFQQIGIHYTTAGNAGFITSLYVVLVPFIGMFFGYRSGKGRWTGALLAVCGLYLLGVNESLEINPGDGLVFISAVFWAMHMLSLSYFSPRTNPVFLSCIQFAVTSVLSLCIAVFFEDFDTARFGGAVVPLLYGGLMSVGVAYTLQVFAQKRAHPAHAAIILSLEGAFAAVGGLLIIGETMDVRETAGCLLMLAGVIAAQWDTIRGRSAV